VIRVRSVLALAACLGLAICLALACDERSGDQASAGESTGEAAVADADEGEGDRRMAPDFVLVSLEGKSVHSEDLRGKTVVIDFWATWCPPCEFQVPELNAFWKAHAGDGDVVVYGISVDLDGPDVVSGWAADKNVQYPVLLEGDDLARRFGALGFPTLYVIAPDGSIDTEHVGLIEAAELEAALARQRANESG
jgi:thiol-disulfide isomerase/thioredoxin